jgi:asparagine synthase (glutamine-hydrolysing)
MCGIAGLILKNPLEDFNNVLNNFSEKLKHRGPDDRGFLSYKSELAVMRGRDPFDLPNGQVGFMHRRLSIIDLSDGGWQPMSDQQNSIFITYNGEIYNYLELRKELEANGSTFKSDSDTEVIIEAYKAWGDDAVRRFVGMFAFALLDVPNQKVFFARDPFGIKPLYYAQTDMGLAFASEMKALIDLPWVDKQLDSKSVRQFIQYDLTDGRQQCLVKSIKRFPAAHYGHVALDRPDEIHLKRYWQLDQTSASLNFGDASEQLRDLFEKSMALHLRSDVPVGVALSGGIDSSSTTMMMRKLLGDQPIHSFSFIASDPKINEEKWIDIVAQEANTISHKIKPTSEEIYNSLDDLIQTQDEPFGSTSILAQYHVFKRVHQQGIKITLEGQGADEILAGYTPYYGSYLYSLFSGCHLIKALKFMRCTQQRRGMSYASLLARLGQCMAPNLVDSFKTSGRYLNAKASREAQLGKGDKFKAHLAATLTSTSLPALLRFNDRNAMRFSVESRVPFLTTELVEFIYSLPNEYLLGLNGETKTIFRKAMRGIVPDIILDRQDKIGFAAPEHQWLRSSQDWVEDTLNIDHGLIDGNRLRNDYQAFLADQKKLSSEFWRGLNFLRWAKNL